MANTNKTTTDYFKSFCNICPKGCGLIIHMKGGKPDKVEGDPEGGGKACIKALNALDYIYHPDRLTHPLIRAAGRGDGQWDRIPWDQALDRVAEALNEVKEKEGAQSVAFIRGASKSYMDTFLARLSNLFGSPNHVTMGQCCHLPRVMASNITCGYYALPDIDYPPSCIILWGYNPEETFFYEYEAVLKAVEKGSKLIVIDPQKTTLAEKADLWIKVRPGTDLALALGMLHVMVTEKIYDKNYVNQWTTGFDRLEAHVQTYTPEKTEAITWIPREAIKEAARIYAESRPACIMLGNAIDQNINSFQTARAIMILKAISGNIGIPGGEINWTPLPIMGRVAPEATLGNKITDEIMGNRVGADCNILPMFKPVMPDNVIKAILEEKPYPIRAALVQGGNPLLTFPNTQNVFKAFNKLDFLVVIDMFMTPTATLADIVLPASAFMEYDNIFVPPQNVPMVLAQEKITEMGECWSDNKIVIELAKKMGLGEEFLWETEDQALNAIMKPSGLSFEEFKQIRRILSSKAYRQHEAKGFNTPTNKIEIYSDRLKGWGYDPLPIYYEPPETPYSEPDLSEKFPFILTSFKPGSFRHSWGHQIKSLRNKNPEPIVMIHRETAQKKDIHEGDSVYIETKRGRIQQKARLTSDIDPRVIIAEFGWWDPEKDPNDSKRWAKSNINILTDDKTPFNRAMGAANELGSPTLKGLFCNVYK